MSDNTIRDFSELQMLRELIRRGKIQEAPRKITFAVPYSSVLVGIGKDYFADIIIANDAIAELEQIFDGCGQPAPTNNEE
jgi:hypothetical protein